MLERYILLKAKLEAPSTQTWREKGFIPAPSRPPGTVEQYFQAEVGDIVRCFKLARLRSLHKKVLNVLYRPRVRRCVSCQQQVALEQDRCPKCKSKNFKIDPLPTARTIAEEMAQLEGGSWSDRKIRHIRDEAFSSLEKVMRRRRMLE